jgi:hypothetical protein
VAVSGALRSGTVVVEVAAAFARAVRLGELVVVAGAGVVVAVGTAGVGSAPTSPTGVGAVTTAAADGAGSRVAEDSDAGRGELVTAAFAGTLTPATSPEDMARTRPPRPTPTARSPTAEDNEEVRVVRGVLTRSGARWRPVTRVVTAGPLLHAYEVSCRVRVGESTRSPRRHGL